MKKKKAEKSKQKFFFADNQEFNVAWLVKEGEMGERTREREGEGGGRDVARKRERKNFSPKLNKFWIAICLDIGREKVHGEV